MRQKNSVKSGQPTLHSTLYLSNNNIHFRAEEATQQMVETALRGYEMTLYQESCMMITEEEFVYDSNINRHLSQVVKQCDVLTGLSS